MKIRFIGFLMLLVTVNAAFSIADKQIDFLRTMHELGNDFTQIPVINSNIDSCIEVMQIQIKLAEKRLETATKKVKKSKQGCIAAVAGAFAAGNILKLGKFLGQNYGSYLICDFLYSQRGFYIFATVSQFIALVSSVQTSYSVVKLYDVYKGYNILRDELAVDKTILDKLVAIKGATKYTTNTDKIVA